MMSNAANMKEKPEGGVMEELLPCPFCGSSHIRYIPRCMKCQLCHSNGPYTPFGPGLTTSDYETKARELWNKRITPVKSNFYAHEEESDDAYYRATARL